MKGPTKMDEAGFLTAVHGHVKLMTADGELGLAGYLWRLTDEGLSIMALDLEPPQAWQLFLLEAMKEDTRQIAFCLDRYGNPHQGTLLGDLVAGMYLDKARPAALPRPFIIEYCAKPTPRALWFNWENEFWNGALRFEMLQVLKDLHGGKTNREYSNVMIDADGTRRPMPKNRGRGR
jgi:hypothetical protein